MDTIASRIVTVIKAQQFWHRNELSSRDEIRILEDTHLIHDLGADSLDQVELVMAYEKEFDIDIPSAPLKNAEYDYAQLETIRDAINKVFQYLKEQHPDLQFERGAL